MKKPTFKFYLPLLFSITLIVGMWIGYQVSADIPKFSNLFIAKNKNSFDELVYLIENKYVSQVNIDSILKKSAHDLTKSLDPFSSYINPEQLQQVNEELDGKFEGIGIEYNIFKDTPVVLRVVPNGPAEKAGLQIGDKLLYANDSNLVIKNNVQIIRKQIKGVRGTTVKIKFLREKKIQELAIVRDFIPIKSVPVATMIKPTVAYIQINKFIGETAKEFIQALQKLQSENRINTLVLDLRNNGGGLLDATIEIADEFLSNDKVIVFTKGEHTAKKEFRAKRKGLFEEGQVFILMNSFSASASEVLAGALQDWDRASIVGTNSFGKGLVQEQFSLSNGAAVRLTVAKYFTPSGRCIQKSYNNKSDLYLLDSQKTPLVRDTFKTSKGKLVFANEGIHPDYYIASEKTDSTSFVGKYNSLLFLYSQQFFQDNVSTLIKFKSPNNFNANYSLTEAVIKNFYEYVATYKKEITLDYVKKNYSQINQFIKLELIKRLWNEQETFNLLSENDPYLNKVFELIK